MGCATWRSTLELFAYSNALGELTCVGEKRIDRSENANSKSKDSPLQLCLSKSLVLKYNLIKKQAKFDLIS